MFKKNVNMLSGSIFKGLLAVSLPVMVMNVLQSLFNIIDMSILKAAGSGDNAIGAVGVCSILISLITGLVVGVSSGANVIIARYIGQKDEASARRSVGTALAFSVAAGFALTLIGVLGAEFFLSLVNCPDELLPQAALYFRMYFAGVPMLMVYNFCAAILRSTGDTGRPMIYLTTAGLIKVALNLLFVGQFHWGIQGVGWSTILSWGVLVLLGLRAVFTNQGILTVKWKDVRFSRTEMNQILHIGVPAGLQQALYSIANVIISSTVNTFGPAATTGISIANNFDSILYNISTATALAVMPYVSQNIGAGNLKRAMESVWKGVLITITLGGFFGALSAIFSRQLSGLMTSDPAVIEFSRQKMVLISSTYFICGVREIFGAALRGMGKPTISTISTLLFMCALRFVWVYLIFPLVPNMTFLYLVWPVGWVLGIALEMTAFFIRAKHLKQVHA